MERATTSVPDIDDDDAEIAALAAAVAESFADPRPSVPHAKVRNWLLELVGGKCDSQPPTF